MEGYMALECPCPAHDCSDDKTLRKWQHNSCKDPRGPGKMMINYEAKLKCFHCHQEEMIVKCRFSCGRHEGKFEKPDLVGLAHSITMLRALSTSVSDKKLLLMLGKSIKELMGKQIEEEEAKMLVEEKLGCLDDENF